MNPIAVEDLARARYAELVDLAAAEHAARQARHAGCGVRPWRHAVGRGLVALGVGVGLPRPQRERARRDAWAALCGGQR